MDAIGEDGGAQVKRPSVRGRRLGKTPKAI